MTTLRSSPLQAMDKQEALRVLARDLNTSFSAMYAKFEGDGEEGGEGSSNNALQLGGENLQAWRRRFDVRSLTRWQKTLPP